MADELAPKINDLPIEPLTHVASFLPLPSRALFALSFTDVDTATAFSRKIIAAQDGCETLLDFGTMEKDQAVKLTDEDLDAILRCIDAANKVKVLRLTNCINISGVGLESLRGSETIEKIDFTLVADREVQHLDPQPPLLPEHVVPILDSIIASRGSSLKHLQFPKHWRRDGSHENSDPFYQFTRSDPFHQFMGRFNEYLMVVDSDECWKNRCAHCNEMAEEPPVEMWDGSAQDYGVQYRTCSVCSKHHCDGCLYNSDDGCYNMYFCAKCERTYCSDCSEQYVKCGRCDKAYCMQCRTDVECSEPDCDVEICDDCGCTCLKCKRPYCDFCFTDGATNNIRYSGINGKCNSGQCPRCYDDDAEGQVSNDIQNDDDDLSSVASNETTTTQQPDTADVQEPQMMDGSMAGGPTLSSTGIQQQQQHPDSNNGTATTAAASGTATAGENPSSSNDSMPQNQNNDDAAADTGGTLHHPAADNNTAALRGNVLKYFMTNNSAAVPLQWKLSAAMRRSSTVASAVPPTQANSEVATSSSQALHLLAAVSSSLNVASTVPPAQANSEAAASSSSQQMPRSKRKMGQQGGRENKDTDD